MRKLLGYERYDSVAAAAAINSLYEDLRLLQNVFLPSVKLLEKRRVGARLRRRYDAPRTPLERLEQCADIDAGKLQRLLEVREQIDPFALAQRIDESLARIHRLANRRVGPAEPLRPPRIQSRRALTASDRQRRIDHDVVFVR